MTFFQLYQYVVPLVLLPVAYGAWLARYNQNHALVLLVMSFPITFAYVIPAIGTNWLKLWRFNTRWRLGRFRPYHGFVFGTATSLFGTACLAYPPLMIDFRELARAGFVMGSVIAFWNWLYDLYAIKFGFVEVYNRAYRDGKGPEAIATEYCPVFFGSFGVCYGVLIRTCEYVLVDQGRRDLYWGLLVGGNLVTLVAPVCAYVLYSVATGGESGLRTYEGETRDGQHVMNCQENNGVGKPPRKVENHEQ